MIISIAIQAYFAQMKKQLDRQGFDSKMKVVYAADSEGAASLLDTDMANKQMPRKTTTTKKTTRPTPYTYIFWTRDSIENLVRQSVRLRDGSSSESGRTTDLFKHTVASTLVLHCALVSNKANLVEDFEEAFVARFQNMHTVPVNLKHAYDSEDMDEDFTFTVIQDPGKSELISFRAGNLFSYSWDATIYLGAVSEFATSAFGRLEQIIVDLYSKQGVPLASMDFEGKPEWKTHVAYDGTEVTVPKTPYVEAPAHSMPESDA